MKRRVLLPLSYSPFIKNRLPRILVALLVGLACVFYVARMFDWGQIRASLEKADFLYFFSGAVTTLFAFFFFRTLRWYLLLRSEKLDVPFFKLYLYNCVSIGISNVTPFQSGEALKVEFLRKYGGGRLTGYTIFFLEKFLDLLTALAMAILGIAFGFDSGVSQFYFYAAAALFIIGFSSAVGVVFLFPHPRLNPIRALLREKWRQKWALLLAAGLTVCSWSAAVVGWQMTLGAISINISFLQSMSLISLTMILTIISFVPGAVGVSEISNATILTQMGVESSLAQTGAIALRGYVLTLLVLTFLHWAVLKLIPKKQPIEVVS